MNGDLEGSFELVFSPSLDLISVVRRFVQDFYKETLGLDSGAQLALATHELLENASKYSIDDETSLQIEVRRSQDGHEVVVRTRNRAGKEQVDTVVQLLAELRDSADPFEFYQSVIKRSARLSEGSGLGLARIAAEADMALEYERDGDSLTVTARCSTPLEAAS